MDQAGEDVDTQAVVERDDAADAADVEHNDEDGQPGSMPQDSIILSRKRKRVAECGPIPLQPVFVASAPIRPGGRARRVRQYDPGLSDCICGLPVTEEQKGEAVCCKQRLCETKWYHLGCTDLSFPLKSWTCADCIADGRGSKRRRA
ncbi:hypothetical protein AURDEDRAFT_128055 [Auricularia subglabra TFB-10046 SS5]|nr:hypothetical protein AURDEDRAFT_128055 [Auricularia subglabra TFB-10046 SS5]